jgi:triosephosphate isomerase (TIM)
MSHRPKLVVANWKMHGSATANAALLSALKAGLATGCSSEVAVCVPFPYLGQARDFLSRSEVAWGAQDVSEYPPGPYTGDVSVEMLQDFGCSFAIAGHSERRVLYAESNFRAAAKAERALQGGLRVVFCVGESQEEHDAGKTESVVRAQLDALLDRIAPAMLSKLVVAYEPVWAIGSGKAARPNDVQAVHQVLRSELRRADDHAGQDCLLLYGGSVKKESARELFELPDVDGGLVGGASLLASDFLAIVDAASSVCATVR